MFLIVKIARNRCMLFSRWCRAKGLFAPPGATAIHVFAERYKEMGKERDNTVRRVVMDWKCESGPHGYAR